MKFHFAHRWDVTPQEALQIQERVRQAVIPAGWNGRPSLIAGADAAFDGERQQVYGAVVVLSFPALQLVESVVQRARIRFPYIPGLLAFREAPALLTAFERLRHEPDVVFVDGHGLSHPRAAGIACHIGLCLDRPVIGCAKSRLTGECREPGVTRPAVSHIYDQDGRVIGAVVRTRDRVKPVFVSIGHRISLAEAVRLTLACGKGYRIPEPTRQAHLHAERAKTEVRA
jgi:deoxyribonuclease V